MSFIGTLRERFGAQSVRRQLTLYAMLVSSIVLVVVLGGLWLSDRAAMRRALEGEVSRMGDLVALHSGAALFFDDEATARKTLASVWTLPYSVLTAPCNTSPSASSSSKTQRDRQASTAGSRRRVATTGRELGG